MTERTSWMTWGTRLTSCVCVYRKSMVCGFHSTNKNGIQFKIFQSIGSITDCTGNYSGDTLQHVVNNCVPISHRAQLGTSSNQGLNNWLSNCSAAAERADGGRLELVICHFVTIVQIRVTWGKSHPNWSASRGNLTSTWNLNLTLTLTLCRGQSSRLMAGST